MSKPCRESHNSPKRIVAGATEAEKAAWQEHLARCPGCREQWAADVELRALYQDAETPRLSDRFQQSLRQRIAVDNRIRSRRRLPIMRAYWLAAAVASVLVLTTLDLPGLFGTGTWIAGLLVPVFCLLAPLLLLGLRLPTGLYDLILYTMAAPGESPEQLPAGPFGEPSRPK